jgi:glycosyltransferase involved in cell wall biosynthesis
MPVKLKYVLSHPVQYFVPLLKKLAQVDGINLKVIYQTDAGAGIFYDQHFDDCIEWDTPLLEGYDYTVLSPGKEPARGFFGTRADGVRKHLARQDTDVVIIHGWGCHLYAVATLTALMNKIPVLYRTDAQRDYDRRDFDPNIKGYPLIQKIKPLLIHPLLRRINGFLAIGTLNEKYYLNAGVDPGRIFWAPHCIDTEMFEGSNNTEQERLDEEAGLGLRDGSFRVLFCGKLVERKRPSDILEAVSRMPSKESVEVIFIGNGKLMPDLLKLARKRNIRTHFLGFRNQRELPLLYSLADVLVLPSQSEPWGLVVNEAMTMGLPAIVSDVVGCGPDLAKNGESGYICPVGDVLAISEAIEKMASSPELLERLKKGALERIKDFSMDRAVEGYLEAVRGVLG